MLGARLCDGLHRRTGQLFWVRLRAKKHFFMFLPYRAVKNTQQTVVGSLIKSNVDP